MIHIGPERSRLAAPASSYTATLYFTALYSAVHYTAIHRYKPYTVYSVYTLLTTSRTTVKTTQYPPLSLSMYLRGSESGSVSIVYVLSVM